MALVAVAPLLWLVRDARPRRGLVLGLAFGFAYFGATLYWIWLFGTLAWSALTLVSASFIAAFGALAPVVWRRDSPVRSALALAALWSLLEWIRGAWPLGGFTWGALGQGQVNDRPLLHLASVAGMWGMGFAVVLVNALLLLAVDHGAARRTLRAAGAAAAAALLVLVPALIPFPRATGLPLDVATIQVDVRNVGGGDLGRRERAIALEYARLQERLAQRPPDLVVWGESSVDPVAAADPPTVAAVERAVRTVGAPTLLGTTEPGPGGGLERRAVLLDAAGARVASYAKVHLVPFGEYVPFRRWVGWISATRQIPYDLTPGPGYRLVRAPGLAPLGVAICYENSFPEIERTLVGEGAQLLVVQTNNASYESTAASAQHLLMSRLRAVEEGRWVVHGAISGISAVIDPSGRVVADRGLFDTGIVRATVRAGSGTTLYRRLGPWVPLASLVLVVAVAALPRRRRTLRPGPEPLAEHARTLVVLPTFDERDTIERVLEGVLAAGPGVDALVVDDGSPDGTGAVVAAAASREPRVRLVQRGSKAGLASAYLEGFGRALEEGYDLVVEMDSDLSHDPADAARLLAAAQDHHVVVGSRYVRGGQVIDWGRARLWLSRAGNAYARLWLGIGVRDATSGYRVYRREVLERLLEPPIRSEGYGFQVEMVYRARRAGFDVAEVPIRFRDRQHGRSKLSLRIVAEAVWLVTVWGVRARLGT